MKFPIFAVNCCCLPLSFRRRREKRRKTKNKKARKKKQKKRAKTSEKCVKKGENHSDPIYTNPIKNLPKTRGFKQGGFPDLDSSFFFPICPSLLSQPIKAPPRSISKRVRDTIRTFPATSFREPPPRFGCGCRFDFHRSLKNRGFLDASLSQEENPPVKIHPNKFVHLNKFL